eukprot:TRINITY_DN21404_c0_g2_i1.p1 TRINITY_DN21404_c0_g2~~TRINITY_DN21404_c0_g2_i1.p1  ORF type:complete len:380 (+),score=49.25 TRINITY_DN21404_c0_g2_i1:57-1142(+)
MASAMRRGLVNVLQWNPHWECITEIDVCKKNAERALSQDLVSLNIDFAHVVEIEDSLYSPPDGWAALVKRCGVDWTTLFYNAARWEPSKDAHAKSLGCMRGADRPYLIQQFVAKNSWRDDGKPETLLVVGAHFPHGGDVYTILGDALHAVMHATGVCSVLFIADTNLDTWVPSDKLAHIFRLPEEEKVSSTRLLPTCCAHDGFRFVGFDRIITNAGHDGGEMETTLLEREVPTWANQGWSFHKGVLGKFSLNQVSCPWHVDRSILKLTALADANDAANDAREDGSFQIRLHRNAGEAMPIIGLCMVLFSICVYVGCRSHVRRRLEAIHGVLGRESPRQHDVESRRVLQAVPGDSDSEIFAE